MFFTIDTAAREMPLLAGALCVCGCYGTQHIEWYVEEVNFWTSFSKRSPHDETLQKPSTQAPPPSTQAAPPPPVASSSKVRRLGYPSHLRRI